MHHKKSIRDAIREKGGKSAYDAVEFMLKFYIFYLMIESITIQPGQTIDTFEVFLTALMYGGVFFLVKLLLVADEK